MKALMLTLISLQCLLFKISQDTLYTVIHFHDLDEKIIPFKNQKIYSQECDVSNMKGTFNMKNIKPNHISMLEEAQDTHIMIKNVGFTIHGHIRCPHGKNNNINSDFTISTANDVIVTTMQLDEHPRLSYFELKLDTSSMIITMPSDITTKTLKTIVPKIKSEFILLMALSMNGEILSYMNDAIPEHTEYFVHLKEDL